VFSAIGIINDIRSISSIVALRRKQELALTNQSPHSPATILYDI